MICEQRLATSVSNHCTTAFGSGGDGELNKRQLA